MKDVCADEFNLHTHFSFLYTCIFKAANSFHSNLKRPTLQTLQTFGVCVRLVSGGLRRWLSAVMFSAAMQEPRQ